MSASTRLNLGEVVDINLTREIVAAAVDVHRHLGPGLLESAYRMCLVHELSTRALQSRTEVPIPIKYKNVVFPSFYRADIVVADQVLLELKAVDQLLPIHEAQILTYLKLSHLRVGFLMNFNATRMVAGLRRFVR